MTTTTTSPRKRGKKNQDVTINADQWIPSRRKNTTEEEARYPELPLT